MRAGDPPKYGLCLVSFGLFDFEVTSCKEQSKESNMILFHIGS